MKLSRRERNAGTSCCQSGAGGILQVREGQSSPAAAFEEVDHGEPTERSKLALIAQNLESDENLRLVVELHCPDVFSLPRVEHGCGNTG